MQNEKQQPAKEPTQLHVFSQQYLHYKANFLSTLKQYHKSTLIHDIYFTERAQTLILHERITEVEMFGCGFKKFYYRKNISPYLKLDKIIVFSVVDEDSIKQLEQIGYLFPQIYFLTLQTTNSERAQILKNSELKKSIRSIKEVNLNFFTFLDGAHYIQKMEKSFLFKSEQQRQLPYKYERPSKNQKIGAYNSFLLAYPKLYEYELHYLRTNNQPYNRFISELEKELKESLQIMQKHQKECKNLDKVSSPKIKCLVLNREIINDLISPLIYGYYYGPLCEQFINREKLMEGAEKLGSKGKMYNALFEQDFDQAAEYIQKLTKDKTALEGPFQTNYFYKAKHMIASYEDPSPIELSLHISCWRQTKQQGEYRIKPATMQQDIANRIDEYERKISNGNCISMIRDWILEATEDEAEYVTQDELLKLGIITEITGDLWFFHHNSIKKLLNQPNRKSRYENFLQTRTSKISTHQLTQKPQGQERSQLYRHQPKLISICEQWIDSTLNDNKENNQNNQQNNENKNSDRQKRKKPMEVQFDKKPINNDLMRNRESKLVLLIDGIVGFNELALLRKMIKERTDKSVSILVESFCNTQQYADYLMRPFDKHHRNKNN